MLRPATPLTVLLLISFVLLLLSVISTPIVKSIPIATYRGVNFGVFGYCTTKSCSDIRVGYTTDEIFGSDDNGDFNLPASTRHSLSSLLIVHPVAAFCNLVCLALAAAAHLHSPSHSARYLLGLLILLLPTLLVTLLAFLVDILLFVPHLQWGGWIVLASTILITASGVVTCAMRRTLVSRKARKKRIAENAEMSGENFYNRQAQESKLPAQTFDSAEPTMPMVNGAPGADRLPNFATFESGKPDEDRQPLRSQGVTSDGTTLRDGASDNFYPPPSVRSNSRPPYDERRDQYGNPIPRAAGAMMPPRQASEERTPAGSYREGSVPPPGSRGYGSRGRGKYPSRGAYSPRGGGYGPRGPPPPQGYPGRGGFFPEMRGGYTGRGRGGYPPTAAIGAIGAGMAAGGMMADGQRRPPPGYPPDGGQRTTPPDSYPDSMGPFGPVAGSTPYVENPAPNRADAMSPSVYTTGPEEHLAPYGARAQSPARSGYGSRMQSPVGTTRQQSPPPVMPPLPSAQPTELPTSSRTNSRSQSQDPYIPPRSQWNNVSHEDFAQPGSPGRYTSPVELPSTGSHVGGYSGPSRRPRVNSGGSDVYYEDVDPRFASDPEPMPAIPPNPATQPTTVPPLLTAGQPQYRPDSLALPPSNSYEDLPGARSPAESETSNFTSVSQRGINPNWRPGNGGEFASLGPPRRREHQMRRDVLLAGNPDFEIPGMGGSGRMSSRGGRDGMRGGMMMGGGPPRIPPASAVGMGSDGRYPMGPPPPPAGPGNMREM
ncbi:hypothetical protein PV08_05245 [Exophiala spinifera]|uniref:PH-response regulator protein palI/RIM9 n=1 Tax=Exophiala spinifera TaxID=91928 RepID=A0A0D2B962_9EURO|nr:uncharacterized protein PV08_05245 [Exophiala spinifera]KIW15200.1 hypothetical protein PV08_05245 [Exophiala spinifera]